MQPAPLIVDRVSRIAEQAPHRTAVVADGEVVSYATLHRRIGGVARALVDLGIRPGQTVAVGTADAFVHLLLLAALDACGVCSGSFRPDEGAGCADLLAAADLVLTDVAAPPGPCRQHRTLGRDWLADAYAAPPLAAVAAPADSDAPMMIIRSSGTTGRPKRLLLTRAMLAARCAQRIAAYGMGADTRYLLTMMPSVHSIVVGTVLTWQLGGTVVTERRLPQWLAFVANRPTHATVLPRQLATLLTELPAHLGKLRELRLIVLGARLPADLRAAALARLAGSIVDHYGANEAGMICPLDADAQGVPVPGQTVAIVGPSGRPVAPGEAGRVAVRGAAVAAGYLDAPALTARHFRDGWFLTDDLAVAMGGGRLRLVGRSDEVLNVGGHKLACADVEAELCRRAALADVAVLGAADGAAPPLIACVLHPAETLAQVERRIRDCLPDLLADARLCAVAAMPRTPEGKLRRLQLRAMLGE